MRTVPVKPGGSLRSIPPFCDGGQNSTITFPGSQSSHCHPSSSSSWLQPQGNCVIPLGRPLPHSTPSSKAEYQLGGASPRDTARRPDWAGVEAPYHCPMASAPPVRSLAYAARSMCSTPWGILFLRHPGRPGTTHWCPWLVSTCPSGLQTPSGRATSASLALHPRAGHRAGPGQLPAQEAHGLCVGPPPTFLPTNYLPTPGNASLTL